MLPGVYHYSWYDLSRKIKTYKNYWSQHWQSMYNIVQEDTIENNMFFDKPWSEVTDSEIDNLAKKLNAPLEISWAEALSNTKNMDCAFPKFKIFNLSLSNLSFLFSTSLLLLCLKKYNRNILK